MSKSAKVNRTIRSKGPGIQTDKLLHTLRVRAQMTKEQRGILQLAASRENMTLTHYVSNLIAEHIKSIPSF